MLAPCILVVDDEALIHLMLEADLTDAGFTVIVENSVDDALARLEASGSNCQALVTDINLGEDRSGWDIARHARELNPHIPVVYMTGVPRRRDTGSPARCCWMTIDIGRHW